MTTDSRRFASTVAVLAELGLGSSADPRLEPTRSFLLERGWLVVHEKGTFHAYDDGLKSQPRYLCEARRLAEDPPKARALAASRHFRLVARATIHATETDKAVFCLIPPGAVVGNSALAESSPGDRPTAAALVTMAVCNSRCFDLATRLRLGTNLNQFLLESLPVPALAPLAEAVCAHLALLLTCRHEGYAQLWAEQTGPASRVRVPALGGPDARLRTRTKLDAVVAHAWGLDRAGYAIVLEAARGPDRPFAERCLGAFDELAGGGLEAFAEAHDPLAGLPLVTAIPAPVDARNLTGSPEYR